MTQQNNFWGVSVNSTDDFTLYACPFGEAVSKSPIVEGMNREDLRVLRSVIDQALNTSAEELGDA